MKTEAKKFLSLIVLMVMLSLLAVQPSFAASGAIQLSKKSIVTVKASSYTRASGEIVQEGVNLSFQSNQWVEYDVETAEDGEYDVVMTVGAPTDKTFTVTVNDENPVSTGFSATGGFSTKFDYSVATVKLKAGVNTVRITNVIGSYYFEKIGFSPVKDATDGGFLKRSGSYRTAELPTVIEAENYDLGADGSKSVDGKNNGKAYRVGSIDIYDNPDKNGYYITLATGEYVKYTFTVKEDGAYTMYASGNGLMVDVYFDDCSVPFNTQILKTDDAPETEIISIFLEKGEHTVKLALSTGSLELDYLRFANAQEGYITIDDIENGTLSDKEESNNEEVKHPIYKNIYVAENGSDSNDGTKESPFKTIKRAKEEVSKRSTDMTGDIIVNIAPGYYQLSETEIFDESHSGKNGFNVIYKGQNKFSPSVISGGKKVTGWEKVSDIMWRAPIKTQSSVRNLYINGLPAVRARSKYAYIYSEDYDAEGNNTAQDGFKVSKVNFPVDIEEEKNLELVWNAEWTAQRTLVESVALEDDKAVFTMQQPYWENRNTSTYMNSGSKFYIENAFCLLDEPGEFYYNKEEGYIYYYPYAEEDMKIADTYIGETEGLIKIEGSNLENKVENITFDNLDFRYGAWEEVSQSGLIAVQADWLKAFEGKSQMVPAQIAVNKAKNINFTNSRFSCLGSGAISMVDAVSDSSVIGNLFTDVSGTGVLIGTPNHKVVPEDMEMCENIRVENNVMRRVASEYHGSVGVLVFFEKNIDIIHNTFIDSTYTQVSAGWGWGSDSKTCGEITIAYNRFEDAMHTLRDGAHLYTLGANPGSSINNNYFIKSGPGAAGYGGVYTDSGSAYFNIENNVFKETPKLWFVGQFSTHDNTAKNNYTEHEQQITLRVNSNTISNTTVVKDGNWPEEAKAIMEEAGVETQYKNLINLAKTPEWRRNGTQTIPKGIYQSADRWIEAEDFINGGQNIGYYKITEKINNNGYRSDGVALMESPLGNGYVIHECFDGEWQKYDFEVPNSGTYDLYIKAAHAYSETDIQPGIKISVDGEVVIEEAIIPSTGKWSLITSMKIGEVNLAEGKHVLTSEFLNNGFYLDAFKFVPKGEKADNSAINDPAYDEGKIVYQWEYEKEEEVKEEKIWFSDIVGHWAESDIIKMAELGIVNGYSDEIFAPNDNVTLYQAIWLSMRVMDFEYDETAWQEKAIEYGIYSESFDEDHEITREEFISIIMNAYTSKHGAYNLKYSMNEFKDSESISQEYLVPVLGAKTLGLVKGDENGNFNPKKLLSRAEAVTVFSNVLK